MNDSLKISFGIIVLNGEPFVRYNLRALYPFAHQIIVVEGASPAAAAVATPDGHSTDSTLDTLREFKRNEDPDDKLLIVTAEDNGHVDGFWPGEKHEQSRAYAARANGDFLWQIDIDEFYQPQDMQTVIDLLKASPRISAMSFRTITFWGGFSYLVDSYYLRRGGDIFHRLFRWGPGYAYITHRPPTVHTPSGEDVRDINHITAECLEKHHIYLYHYALVFPKQVRAKCTYYDNAQWIANDGYTIWAEENYFRLKNPFRVYNVYDHPSWLEYFSGNHPPQIQALISDLRKGIISIEERQTEDIDMLLGSLPYRIGRQYLQTALSLSNMYARFPGPVKHGIRHVIRYVRSLAKRIMRTS